MSTNSFLGHDVDLERLAEMTRNFSGAEIEGLVKSAASYALNRNVDINDLHKPLDEDNIKVCCQFGWPPSCARTCAHLSPCLLVTVTHVCGRLIRVHDVRRQARHYTQRPCRFCGCIA